MRRRARQLLRDKRGVAAVEFAVIVPVMLVLFFGVDEFSSVVAVDRKVTLMARTLSDLTSQNDRVSDTQLTNFF
ncbi:MAG: pilus assembly protein TadG, partial [Bradyrhizobium sp.]|nr:pilus assembly protein TadG [Bradyrhizobium sp.]